MPVRALAVLSFLALSTSLSSGCAPWTSQSEPDSAPLELAATPTNAEPEAEPKPEPEAELEPEAEPELIPEPPEPSPFAGREHVRVDELLAALTDEIPAIAASEAVREDFDAFVERFDVDERNLDLDALYLDYVRVRIAFEATRAGGLWGLAWDITNEQPNSEKIWAHWQTLDTTETPTHIDELDPAPAITAIAECDELSALFAYVAQRIGLSKPSEVGLFWPTGNHTVAVWTIEAKSDKPLRIVIPTSQVFLDGAQSLGTEAFDPWTQKRIFDYRRADVSGEVEIPAQLAARFIVEVRDYGHMSQAELQTRRNQRELEQRRLMGS